MKAVILAAGFGSRLMPCENHIGEHKVRLKSGSEVVVNSFHNYAISKLGQDLEPLALAEDESVEAFRHKSARIWALMWHIEREGGLSQRSILEEWLENLKEKR